MPPRVDAPVVFNSPHSGDDYPDSFLARSRLCLNDLRRSADLHVDALIAGVTRHGLPVMRVTLPRSFIDLNREPYELDPRMFRGPLPRFANTTSVRATSGYGSVPRLVAERFEIYAGKIDAAEALERIGRYHLPYHAALWQLIGGLHETFGRVLLVDCHSMPAASTVLSGRPVDVVLGDRHGSSCDPAIIACAERVFEDAGLATIRNQPYAGGYITEHYGRPMVGLNTLQIEINRALYMDESSYRPHDGYGRVAGVLDRLAQELARLDADWQAPAWRQAAE